MQAMRSAQSKPSMSSDSERVFEKKPVEMAQKAKGEADADKPKAKGENTSQRLGSNESKRTTESVAILEYVR
jgi:hypothetical protein